MSEFRVRNRVVAAKIQSAEGVDAGPTLGADAVLVETPNWSPNIEVTQTEEVTGSLDPRTPIAGGGNVGGTYPVLLKGAAPGAAPEAGVFFRGCAMSETLTVADITGTAQGGAAGSVTLAAGASATDDAYKGMVVSVLIGSGPEEERIITGYNGTTKVAAVDHDFSAPASGGDSYTIYANALYRPVSQDLETLTIYDYQKATASATNSLLRRVIDAAGNLSLELPARGPGRVTFSFTGVLPAAPTNVADPGAATYDSTRPPPFIAATSRLGGAAVKFNRFTLDLGAEVNQPDDPDAAFGYGAAGVTSRRITGTINPALSLLSTRNNLADFLAGTTRSIALRYGTTAGNRIAILIPQARYTGAQPSDVNGYAAEDLSFQALGEDSGVYLTFF